MSNCYLGEIRMFAGAYAPVGWAYCDGSLLPKGDYGALFNLIGITYGGDGVNQFALPDLRGRVAIGQGQGGGLSQRTLGQRPGSETVTLSIDELTKHNHVLAIGGTGDTGEPKSGFPASPAAKERIRNNFPIWTNQSA